MFKRKAQAQSPVLASEYEGPSVALIEFYPWNGERFGGAEVSWLGDVAEIPHLPGCYLDRLLTFTRPRRSAARRSAESVLNTFETYLMTAQAAIAAGEAVPRAGVVALGQSDAAPEATAQIELMMNLERQRYGAITTFEPRAAQKWISELTLWVAWDWIVSESGDAVDVVEEVVDNLVLQCRVYREQGLPKLRHLGKAPFYAGMKNASEQLADELGAIAGVTGDEFRRLPQAEQDRIIDEHARRERADSDDNHA